MRLIIVEGPDGAGKSTLVKKLEKQFNAMSIHNCEYPSADGDQLEAIFSYQFTIAEHLAMRAIVPSSVVILDRSFLSELIYGPVYRGKPRLSDEAKGRLNKRLSITSAMTIICHPTFSVCRDNFLSGREEMLDSVEQLQRVWDGYHAANLPLDFDASVTYYDYIRTPYYTLVETIRRHWEKKGV